MVASLPSMGVVVRASLLVALFCLTSTSAFTSSLASVRSLKHDGRFVNAEMRLRPATGVSMMAEEVRSRREVLWAFGGLAAGIVVHTPAKASAEEKAAAQVPEISLKKFYESLALQEVEQVEFDGPQFERAYVTIKGKQFLIGEGYVKESSISSVGPQQVLAKIKNEMKAGNPVKWNWRAAAGFKKKAKPAEPEVKDAKKEGGEGKAKTQEDKNEPSFFGIKIPKQLGAS